MAKIVAKVYSDALFELALEQKKLDQVNEEIQVIKEAVLEETELLQFLNHPKISKEEKIQTIENIFKGRVSDMTVGFLASIVEKGRYNELLAILDYFLNEVREYRKIGKAVVISAQPLSDSQKDRVEERLLATTSYVKFEMEYQVDSSIIGGLIIRIGDRVVDSSVKSKLELLKKDLLKLQLAN